jgi:hypothetical protein
MERLVLCSKILYDKDLLDKKNEIIRLEKIINKRNIIISESLFNNVTNNPITTMFANIQSVIYDCIIYDPYEYEMIIDCGITNILSIYLENIIYIEINKINEIGYETISSNIAYDIVCDIESMIKSLYITNKINNFTNIELVNLILESIKWKIYNVENSKSIIIVK